MKTTCQQLANTIPTQLQHNSNIILTRFYQTYVNWKQNTNKFRALVVNYNLEAGAELVFILQLKRGHTRLVGTIKQL